MTSSVSPNVTSTSTPSPQTSPQPGCTPAVFISGGAQGIGQAIAQELAHQGWQVGIYDVRADAAQALAASLGGCGTHLGGHLDVSDPTEWMERLQEFVAHTGGRLDALVNNAGIVLTQTFESSDIEQIHRIVDVNLKGVINGCHTALPHLKRTPGSRVVNLCSASALYGQPMLATYSATKAAVRSLTESLDIEWQMHGVRVVDVLPFFVNTAMVRDNVSKMATVQRLGVHIQPQDVAVVVSRLIRGQGHKLPVHTAVGWQTRIFGLAAKLSPTAINKWVTARLAGF